MKIFDIAIKDLTRSLRSMTGLAFMFVIPLLMTGMFYFMFGNIAQNGEFNLPRIKVAIANLDEGGPNLHLRGKNIPGNLEANTLGELVVKVLQSDDLADLIDPTLVPDAGAARTAVDNQQAQVAVIIPADFSRQFADLNGDAVIEFYQDPTLTIGPGIVKSLLSQFMDGMAGVNIAADIAQEQYDQDPARVGVVIQQYLALSMTSNTTSQDNDLAKSMLDVSAPAQASKKEQSTNLLLKIIGPIMGGMAIFYAFYTGTASAESILREEEERTLPRLFTTPTSQATILGGKLLSVFLTVAVQMVVLILVSRLLFGIDWGAVQSVALMTVGVVFTASSLGIFINSFLKNTKQGGVIFGGVLTVSGMVGMIRVFVMDSSDAPSLGHTVSLLVPQGWAVRGMLQAMAGEPVSAVLINTLVMLAWGAVFFLIGVWRFNRRYA